MGNRDVLDRVAADLARGHTQPAIQRLSSLVAAHPTDLDLRRRLAAVHRRVGNDIEAGRWSYLQPDADAGAVLAFERAYPSPELRLRALRWPGEPNLAATSFAREQLARLTTQARSPRPSWSLPKLIAAGIASIFALICIVIGALTVIHWLS